MRISKTIEETFKKAADKRRLCEMTDITGNKRIVAPHGIFSTSEGTKQLCCFQYSGFSESGGLPNWRNFHIDNITGIKILQERFTKRKDFNVDNKQVYPHWHFHV